MNATMQSKNAPAPDARPCWSCHASIANEHFCPSCGKIQPLPQGADYFAFFGLPRKLRLDSANLEQRFHQLSWKLHPDNFVRATESERNLSLERSSELNDAYRTLREPVSRVEYLLANSGMRKEGEQKQQAPPELLAEVFELNESLDELREARQEGGDATARAEITERLREASADFEAKLSEVDAELDQVSAEWDETIDHMASESSQRALMTRMNEILNRRSYIRNLVRKVAEELSA
jgi:molecular chaperone HscB